MTNPSSDSYKKFFNFFTLTGHQRMEGLDKSYFENMTNKKKESAFVFLKEKFTGSEESIRGMLLCDEKKSILEFKKAINSPAPESDSKRQYDNFEFCRAVMLNHICRENPSTENIDLLASIGKSTNEDTRAYVYQNLPSLPTTQRAIDILKSAVFTEYERIPLSSAISKLMEIYGHETNFDPENTPVKDLYLKLRSEDAEAKKIALESLEKNLNPIFAP